MSSDPRDTSWWKPGARLSPCVICGAMGGTLLATPTMGRWGCDRCGAILLAGYSAPVPLLRREPEAALPVSGDAPGNGGTAEPREESPAPFRLKPRADPDLLTRTMTGLGPITRASPSPPSIRAFNENRADRAFEVALSCGCNATMPMARSPGLLLASLTELLNEHTCSKETSHA